MYVCACMGLLSIFQKLFLLTLIIHNYTKKFQIKINSKYSVYVALIHFDSYPNFTKLCFMHEDIF